MCILDFGEKQVSSPNVEYHFTSWPDIVKCRNILLSCESDRGHWDLPLWWPCGIRCTGYAFSNNSWAWSSWCCGECWARSDFSQTRYETAVKTNPVLRFQTPQVKTYYIHEYFHCTGKYSSFNFFQGYLKGYKPTVYAFLCLQYWFTFRIFYSISFGFGKNICSLLSTYLVLFLSWD